MLYTTARKRSTQNYIMLYLWPPDPEPGPRAKNLWRAPCVILIMCHADKRGRSCRGSLSYTIIKLSDKVGATNIMPLMSSQAIHEFIFLASLCHFLHQGCMLSLRFQAYVTYNMSTESWLCTSSVSNKFTALIFLLKDCFIRVSVCPW